MPCRLASLSHEVTSTEGDPTPRPSAPGPPIGGGNAARLAHSSWDMHTAPLVARVHLRQAMWQWTLASDVGPGPLPVKILHAAACSAQGTRILSFWRSATLGSPVRAVAPVFCPLSQ